MEKKIKTTLVVSMDVEVSESSLAQLTGSEMPYGTKRKAVAEIIKNHDELNYAYVYDKETYDDKTIF